MIKKWLPFHFHTNNLGLLRYILGIEVARRDDFLIFILV